MNFNDLKNNINDKWKTGKIQSGFRMSLKIILRVALFFIIIGVLVGTFATATGAGYFASLIKDEPIQSYDEMKRDIYNYEESSKIYFAGDKFIGDIQADLQRDEIKLDKVSQVLIDAVLATEDENFYEHNGIVPTAILRAVIQEVTNSDVQTGGSTLTQQLIKNQILSNEVSFDRKAKEIVLAMHLENNFEKDDILEAYLNVIPYGRDASGRNIAGIQKASQGVFGKNADELSLPQAAYLSGLPKNPYAYTPFMSLADDGKLKDEDGLKPGLDRMKVVLKRMYTTEVITKKEYDDALNYNIVEDFTEKKASPVDKYPVLVFEIEKRAKKILMKEEANKDGYSLSDLNEDEALTEEYTNRADRALRMNGYKIHTTIDKDLYEAMQKTAKEYKHYGPDNTFTVQDPNTGESESVTESIEAGAVLMENNSGKILSFVGNRNASANDHYNFSMNAKRSAGSTIKPIGVYAPGMDLGAIQPGTVLPDIPGRKYGDKPAKNYSHTHYGLVSAREALTNSYNVSTVEAYKKIVNQNPVKNYLGKMNIGTSESEQSNLSFALGSVDMSVEQNTNAFATLANNGQFADSYMIEKITTKEDEPVFEHESEPVEVYSPQSAYLTIDIMRDVLTKGTGTYVPTQLTTSGVDWAGKTGTTQDFHDAWFIGSNPNVTLGTWIGYKTPASIWCDNCSLSYSQRTQNLWANLINKATEIDPELMAPKERFKQPKGIVNHSYCGISGLAPSKLCSDLGLVSSDIYDAKYVPTKQDDSLVRQSGKTKLVLIKGKEVVAGDKTPSEFTFSGKSSGYAFNPDFLKEKDYDKLNNLSELFPRNNRSAWEKISLSGSKGAASSSISDDGKSPSKPGGASLSGTKLSWSASDSSDVVGYRIYKGSSEVGSTTSTSVTLSKGDGSYTVKAVDYFGRESGASNKTELTKAKDKKDKNKEKDKKDKDKKDKDKDKKDKDKDKDKKDKDKDKKDKDKDKDKKEKDKKEKDKKEKEEKDKKKAEDKKKKDEKKKDKDD